MYKSLGYTPPEYIHMPVIVAPDRKKLSKRRGAVPILEYRDMGYLSEALFNFLVLIGWSLDDKTEIMSRAQIVENFSIERMGKTAAAFNQEKLDWMNGVYIRELPPEKLADMVMPFLEKWLPPEITRPLNTEYVKNIVPLIRERILTLKAAAEYAAFFFTDNMVYDVPMLLGKKTDAPTALKALKATDKALAPLQNFTAAALEEILRKLAEELGIKAGQLFNVLRVATTARDAAPPLFDTMAVLGKDRCLKRIRAAITLLENNANS